MGPLMLLVAIIIALFVTKRYSKLSVTKINKTALFFFILGPSNIISYMIGHLGFVSGIRIYGAFHHQKLIYDFRTYGLFLMGSVFLLAGIYMLSKIKEYISGYTSALKAFYTTGILLVVHSLPALPLNPLAIVPAVSFIISIISLQFVKARMNLYFMLGN